MTIFSNFDVSRNKQINPKFPFDFEILEENTEPPSKRMKMEKTPISILTELCSKKNVNPPIFTEIAATEPIAEKLCQQQNFKFFFHVNALRREAYGAGMTKKMAKQNAANCLLNKLNRVENSDSDEEDDDIQDFSQFDSVSELLNFCVQRNQHKPIFKEVESYGPSHCPIFTCECRLDSIVRNGIAPNKKDAKKKAAKKVLDILKSVYPNMEKNIALINDENLVKEEAQRIITSYMKFKETGKVDKMGLTSSMSMRNRYFLEYYNEEFINSLKSILLQKNLSDEERLKLFLEALKTVWTFEIDNFANTSHVCFTLHVDFDQFPVSIIAPNNDQLREMILNYFENMLEITPVVNQNITQDPPSIEDIIFFEA